LGTPRGAHELELFPIDRTVAVLVHLPGHRVRVRRVECGWIWSEGEGEGADGVGGCGVGGVEVWACEMDGRVAAEAEAENEAEIKAGAESTSQIISSTSFFLGL
tara:strand:+ start:838 stop:1149 length:312 start_codon:yes stop_codon:yes gene_type:complete